MGQKVHPNGFRLGVIRDWDAKWFATGTKYAASLVSDQKVRAYLRSKLVNAAVSRVELVLNLPSYCSYLMQITIYLITSVHKARFQFTRAQQSSKRSKLTKQM